MDNQDRPFKCYMASCTHHAGYADRKSLLRHQRMNHGMWGGALTCPEPNCPRHTLPGLECASRYNDHRQRHHNGEGQVPQRAGHQLQQEGTENQNPFFDAFVDAPPPMAQILPLLPTQPAYVPPPLPPHAAAVRPPTLPTLLDNSNTNCWHFAAFPGPLPSSIPPGSGPPGVIYSANPIDFLRPGMLRAGAPHPADAHAMPSEWGPAYVNPPHVAGPAEFLADFVTADRAAAGARANPAAAGEPSMAVVTPAAAAAVNTAQLASAPHHPHQRLYGAPPVSARGNDYYNNDVGIANVAEATNAATTRANDDEGDYDLTEAAATDTAVADAAAAAGIGWAANAAGQAPAAAEVVRATAASGRPAIAGAASMTGAEVRPDAAAGKPTYAELLARNRFLEAELARLRQ